MRTKKKNILAHSFDKRGKNKKRLIRERKSAAGRINCRKRSTDLREKLGYNIRIYIYIFFILYFLSNITSLYARESSITRTHARDIYLLDMRMRTRKY